MTRYTRLGLALVIAFALSVAAAGAAQAAVPKFWVCKPQVGGKFEPGCTTAGTTYELEELKGSLKIKSSSRTSRLWVTASLKLVIVCTANTDTGEIEQKAGEPGKNKKVQVTYTGCIYHKAELNAAKAAWIVGPEVKECVPSSKYFNAAGKEVATTAGTIETSILKSTLAFYPGVAQKEVVDVLEPETAGQAFVTIVLPEPCAAEGSYPVSGSVIGKVKEINKPVLVNTLLFEVTNVAAGVTQKPLEYEELSGKLIPDSLKFGTLATAYESEDTLELESKEAFEVRP